MALEPEEQGEGVLEVKVMEVQEDLPKRKYKHTLTCRATKHLFRKMKTCMTPTKRKKAQLQRTQGLQRLRAH